MAVWRRRWILLLTALLPAVLGGCMLSASPEDLYALPQLPEEYESLSAQLSEVLSAGAEYAAPQAGGNLPPVQMVDLNGDGRDEIVCIFHYTDTAGADDQELHVFDAQTLEEYDLSGLRQSVVGRYECTEDETCFYLEGPGVHGQTRIRKAEGEVEAVSVGEHVRYSVQDGGVLCWVELEMSGADLHGVYYISVSLDFTGSGFRIGAA